MSVNDDAIGLELEKMPAGAVNARLARTIRDATLMMEKVLQDLGYTGPWKLRPVTHVSPVKSGRFFCSRIEPDGLRVRIQPAGNDSCWEYLLKGPPGTSPLTFQLLKDDLKKLKNNGTVPDTMLRTAPQLRDYLREQGVSLHSANAAAGAESTIVESQPGTLVPRPVRERVIDRRRATRTPDKEIPAMAKSAPQPTAQPVTPSAPAPARPAHEQDVAGQLLMRKRAIAEFEADMSTLENLHAEKHVLSGELEAAQDEVKRVNAGLAAVDQKIRQIHNKWPDPSAMQAEKENLRQLVQMMKEMMS